MESTQMLKGLLPLVTLSVCEHGDSYGYEVWTRLRSAGLDSVGDASVYGTLQRLYDAGLLSSYMLQSESGPPRRYYALTTAGSAELKTGRELWASFQGAVTSLLETDPGLLP